MTRGYFRSLVAWSLIALVGCTAGAGGCGGCAEDIPGGFPEELRVKNAISAKVSNEGFRFFESRVNEIIGALAGGLQFQVGCQDFTQKIFYEFGGVTVIDQTVPIFLCDHNRNNSCSDELSGASLPPVNDPSMPTNPPLKECQAAGEVKTLEITPRQANPSAPVIVNVKLQLRVNTGAIPIRAKVPVCGNVSCTLEYDSNSNTPPNVPLDVDLELTLDPKYGDILAFEVKKLDVSKVIDLADLKLSSSTSGSDEWCSYVCDIAGFLTSIEFVRDQIMNLVKGMLNSEVQKVIDGFRCRSCAADSECPSTSTCKSGMCVDSQTNKCVPALLGLEGRINPGEMLASFGGSTTSLLDVYAVAGGKNQNGASSVKAEGGGLVIGIMGGTRSAVYDGHGSIVAPGVASCVPARTFARRPEPNPVNYDVQAQIAQVSDYQLGLGLSDGFLDQALFDAYQSGLLCLNLDSNVSSMLSTSLFTAFLPSLGVLTQQKDVPMLMALRPKEAPEIIIGKGSTKVVDGKTVPDDPLITVKMDDVQIDAYALIEDRFARLFSLRTDIKLPLSLDFTSDNKVQIVLADLKTLLSNVVAQNSEMLAEDPQVVADLLDAVIGLVQPVLATALAPIELPEFSGFQLEVRKALGVMPLQGQPGHEHLAIFANLKLPGSPYTLASGTRASLVDTFVPDRAALRAGARPKAVVDLVSEGLVPRGSKGWEYSWRVNGGLWSPWTTQTRVEIAAPVLLLQGRHFVEFRTRLQGEKNASTDELAGVVVEIDYDAPNVVLRLDPETRMVVTKASDAVSRADELHYSYRVSGGAWTAFGGKRAFSLDELGANPSLEVEVVDASGNKARTWFGEPGDQVGAHAPVDQQATQAAGCASAGGSLLALAALAFIRRRRRG